MLIRIDLLVYLNQFGLVSVSANFSSLACLEVTRLIRYG